MSKRMLITAGGTREPIDGVRFISNMSTGLTGARLAESFTALGYDVTLLCASNASRPSVRCEIHVFDSFVSLDLNLQRLLEQREFEFVIHLAAVSDYSLDSIEVGDQRHPAGSVGKLDSSKDAIVLRLKRNFKIVDRIQGYSKRKRPCLVAFKLTHTSDARERLEAVTRLARSPGIDLIVHNDLHDRETRNAHFFSIFKGNRQIKNCEGSEELARCLDEIFGRLAER
jgi:phosphopantothenoylcysteine decarboxylase/phosphopantothenate--cysteine ligase